MIPFGTGISSLESKFQVKFDQQVRISACCLSELWYTFLYKVSIFFAQIRLPSLTRYIRLFNETEKETPVAEFDSSSDSRVMVQDNTLSFVLDNHTLEDGSAYYVLIEAGAVVGLQKCAGGGVPFSGLPNKTEWRFETGMISSHFEF